MGIACSMNGEKREYIQGIEGKARRGNTKTQVGR
jgi:hypothetical protein